MPQKLSVSRKKRNLKCNCGNVAPISHFTVLILLFLLTTSMPKVGGESGRWGQLNWIHQAHCNGSVCTTPSFPTDPRPVSFARHSSRPVWWQLLCPVGTASCKLLLHPGTEVHQRGFSLPIHNPPVCHATLLLRIHANPSMLRIHPLDMYFQFCKTHPGATVVFSPQSHHFSQHPNQQKLGIFCFHWAKNMSSALCYSLSGKTQNSLSHTHFQTAMSNQMWDQIYCKRLLLGHESPSKSLMP